MAILLNIEDPYHWDPLQAWQNIDSIYCAWYDGRDVGGFDNETLLKNMMDMLNTEFTYTLTDDATELKLFINGMLGGIVDEFKKHVNRDKGVMPLADNIYKYFYYSDHDDSYTTLSTALSFPIPEYPPFASQFLSELWKINGAYYVNITRNSD